MADRNIYISSSAAAGGDGSIETPYDSFADINWTTGGANSITDWVVADDDVYINLKGTFSDALIVGVSGSSSSRITIQGYDTGANMYGSKVVTGWTLTSGQTNTYEITEDNAGYDECVAGHFTVFEDYKFMSEESSIEEVEATAGSCWYDTATNKMYIHPFDSDNPSTNGHTYRATQNVFSIWVDGEYSYVSIKDINFYFNSSYAIKPFTVDVGDVYFADNLIYSNLTIIAPRHDGLGIGGTNITASNISISHAYGNGAFVFANRGDIQASPDGDNIVISNCALTDNSHYDDFPLPKYVCGLKFEGNAKNISIENINISGKVYYGVYFEAHTHGADTQTDISLKNISFGDLARVIEIDNDINNLVLHGLSVTSTPSLNDAFRLGSSENLFLTGSTLTGKTTGSDIVIDMETSVNAKIQFNIFNDFDIGISVSTDTINAYICNNTFINGNLYGIYSVSDSNGLYLYNNIFKSVIMPYAFPALANITESDYNLFYDYTSITGQTFSTIQGLGFEINSLNNQDPLFVNAATEDFRIQSTSPCIDAGVIVAGVNDIGQLDPWGSVSGPTPNIGADQGSSQNLYRRDTGFVFGEPSYTVTIKKILPTA